MYDIEHVRHSTVSDAYDLGTRLREADVREIAATQLYKDPTDALMQGLLQSKDCWTITEPETNRPLAMFGVMPEEMLYTPVWLLGTHDIEKYATRFLRVSRRALNRFVTYYGVIGNYVDVRNEVHIHWLEWNGFNHCHTLPSPGGETLFKLYLKD